jgi:hypothetical protein
VISRVGTDALTGHLACCETERFQTGYRSIGEGYGRFRSLMVPNGDHRASDGRMRSHSPHRRVGSPMTNAAQHGGRPEGKDFLSTRQRA